MTRAGLGLLVLLLLACAFAPWLTLHPIAQTHRDNVLAPPMPIRLHDASGAWSAPLVYPLRLEDRLARTYAADARTARRSVRMRTCSSVCSSPIRAATA